MNQNLVTQFYFILIPKLLNTETKIIYFLYLVF
jgi:hypothetical protein